MRSLILALLLVLPVLGCVNPVGSGGKGDPNAGLVGAIANLKATVASSTRQGNEVSVAVNPLDAKNIVVTAKDYTPDEAGDCVWAGLYATKDGGLTWKDQNVPGSPWKHETDPTLPVTPFTKFWCVTDPQVRFGPDGTLYWAVMPYQCDPATGSKTGRGVLPQGGFNDFLFSCASMFMLTSSDGGFTFPLDKVKEIATGPQLVHDKEWFAITNDGQRLIYCWDYSDGGSTTTGSDVVAPDPNAKGHVVCSASKDKGASWSKFAPATNAGGTPAVDYDAKGTAWLDVAKEGLQGAHFVLSSADGVTWTQPVKIADAAGPTLHNSLGRAVLDGSDFRVSTAPGSLGVDRSTGPHAGRVYVTYFDYAAGNGDTMLVWSDDGKTWSKPVRVNDDTGKADQFMPALSVGPDGTVDVSWYDRRDDPANHLFDAYYAYSLDGGVTFSKNVRVSNVSSDEQYSHHQNGAIFLGDYRDMASSRGSATLVWVDTRDHKADVFVATVPRPSANP